MSKDCCKKGCCKEDFCKCAGNDNGHKHHHHKHGCPHPKKDAAAPAKKSCGPDGCK